MSEYKETQDGKFVKAYKYFLTESIKPHIIDYGTDCENKKWLHLDIQKLKLYSNLKFKKFRPKNFFTCTFFKYKNVYYQFYITDDERINIPTIGFSFSNVFDVSQFDNIEYIMKNFRHEATYSGRGMSIFSIVFYLLLEAIRKFNLLQFCFKSASDSLGYFYNHISENEKFMKTLNEYGIYLDKKLEEYHIFEVKHSKNVVTEMIKDYYRF